MPDWLFQVLGVAVAGVSVYVGIRADIVRLHERVTVAAEDARHANRRIDGLLIERRGSHG